MSREIIPIKRRRGIMRNKLLIHEGLTIDELVQPCSFTKHQILKKNNTRDVIIYKQTIMAYFFSEGYSWTEIGKMFGLTHATVIYTIKTIEMYISTKDALFMDALRDLRKAEPRKLILMDANNFVESQINLESYGKAINIL